jgi:4-amino-4-deoxy-L-arabinose transferase-like glycosyltransferase
MSTSTLAPSRPLGLSARALVRGRAEDPAWVRPALIAVVVLTALLCLWDITISGYGNAYYAAAAKAGSVSWKAWFFGSLDPGSFITVDKPPLSLWVLGLSVRVFGFSSASLLVPQALMTIASVALLYATVRRAFAARVGGVFSAPAFAPAAGLLAAAGLALTPVVVALGRFDDPDALLVLLFVGAAYLFVRALESGATKWLVWAGVVVGLAFMTKMLQGWMIVPALVAAYLLAGPPPLGRRLWQLGLFGAVMVAVSAAWPVAVSVWPGAKPYVGGSTDGSVWDLIFGYNGFGRIFGGDGGPGGGGGPTFGGQSGLLRMFNDQVGAQVAWLLPVAAVGLIAGLWLTRRAPRTDRVRAAWVLFGLWAVVHVVVFSGQEGIFHPYYVSASAPAVAALAGAGEVMLWRWSARSIAGLVALDLALLATAVVALVLLRRADYASWLLAAVPAVAAMTVFGITWLRLDGGQSRRPLAAAVVAGVLALLAAPAAYSVATTGHALAGGNLLGGPTQVSQGGFGGPAAGGPRGGGLRGAPPAGTAAGASGPTSGAPPFGRGAGSGSPGAPPAGGFGGPGASAADSALVNFLTAHQGSAKYLVAATGSQATAPIIIATGKPVVTIGGFNGGDNAPTVTQLAQLVRSGQLRYVLVGGGGAPGGGPGGGSDQQAIQAWVRQHGTAVTGLTSGGGTLYRVSA